MKDRKKGRWGKGNWWVCYHLINVIVAFTLAMTILPSESLNRTNSSHPVTSQHHHSGQRMLSYSWGLLCGRHWFPEALWPQTTMKKFSCWQDSLFYTLLQKESGRLYTSMSHFLQPNIFVSVSEKAHEGKTSGQQTRISSHVGNLIFQLGRSNHMDKDLP